LLVNVPLIDVVLIVLIAFMKRKNLIQRFSNSCIPHSTFSSPSSPKFSPYKKNLKARCPHGREEELQSWASIINFLLHCDSCDVVEVMKLFSDAIVS